MLIFGVVVVVVGGMALYGGVARSTERIWIESGFGLLPLIPATPCVGYP